MSKERDEYYFRGPRVHQRITLLLKRREGMISEQELMEIVKIFDHGSFRNESKTAAKNSRISLQSVFLEQDENSIREMAEEFLKQLYIPMFIWSKSIPKKGLEIVKGAS